MIEKSLKNEWELTTNKDEGTPCSSRCDLLSIDIYEYISIMN